MVTGDLTALQHADVAVLAAIQALLPFENADETELDTDEQGLGACVRITHCCHCCNQHIACRRPGIIPASFPD